MGGTFPGAGAGDARRADRGHPAVGSGSPERAQVPGGAGGVVSGSRGRPGVAAHLGQDPLEPRLGLGIDVRDRPRDRWVH
jgi:hypothetical protein